MGYTTDFSGSFKFDKPLDKDTLEYLHKFAQTRRMKRNIKGYGVEGEFYVGGVGFMGQGDDSTVIDHNSPPKTQPGLWCQWIPNDDGTALVWDEVEKFYDYVEWLEYLIDKILAPRGYKLTGEVKWYGEDSADMGIIKVKNNKVKVLNAKITYK